MGDAACGGAPGVADPDGAPLLLAGAGAGRGSDGGGRGRGREGLVGGGDGEIGEEVLVERLGEATVEVAKGGGEVVTEDDHAFEEGSEVFFSAGHLAGRRQFDRRRPMLRQKELGVCFLTLDAAILRTRRRKKEKK